MLDLAVFAQEPVLAVGLERILASEPEIRVVSSCSNFEDFISFVQKGAPDVLLVDLVPEFNMGHIHRLRGCTPQPKLILWAHSVSLEEAHHASQLGVRGILPKRSSVDLTIRCIRKVGEGELWFDRDLMNSLLNYRTVRLSPRESQLLELVSQGMSNKQIASALMISEGTVKVYFSKLFRKVGVTDRFELALYGLEHRSWKYDIAAREVPKQPARRASTDEGETPAHPMLRQGAGGW